MVQLFYSQFMLFTITIVGKSGSITYPAATHTSENLINAILDLFAGGKNRILKEQTLEISAMQGKKFRSSMGNKF